MGIIQKDAFRTMLISYGGIGLGYLNKGLLFLLILTTEQIGLINLIIAVGVLFAQFANFGTVYATWKFVPFFKNKSNNHYGFLSLMLLIVLIGIIVCLTIALLLKSQIENIYVQKSALFIDYYYWVFPIGIAYVLYLVLEVFLRSFYKNILSAFAYEIVLRLALTILLLLLWMNWINFHVFVILHSLIYIIPTLILLIYLHQIGELNLSLKQIRIAKRFQKIIVYFSAFSYFNTLGTVFVTSLDVMMIAQFLGLKATGVYATVIFLSSALQVPYKSIVRVGSPLIADYWKHREFDKMEELYKKVSSVALIIGLSSFWVLWILIDWLFTFLKPEFGIGVWVFLFIMIGRLVDMYFGLNGAIFTTSKKYKFEIIFTLFLILSVFLLNLLLIPIYGIVGAAISTSIAIILYNIGRLLFVYIAFKLHPFQRNQLLVLSLFAMNVFLYILVIRLVDRQWLEIIFSLILFLLTFLFPIWYFKLETEFNNYFFKAYQFVKKRRV